MAGLGKIGKKLGKFGKTKLNVGKTQMYFDFEEIIISTCHISVVCFLYPKIVSLCFFLKFLCVKNQILSWKIK